MNKRDHPDGGFDTDGESKRQRVYSRDLDAILDLAQNAESLINSLQELKSWKVQVDSQIEGDSPTSQYDQLEALRKVSRDALPSLSALANQSPPTVNSQHIPLDSPWISSEIPDELPPLPSIKDPSLEKQAFRHPAILGEGPSYERLEWLGDAYLEVISSCYILSTFPDLPSGRCSQIRERLICNKQLARYFRNYDLMPKAKIPVEVLHSEKTARGVSADKDLIKVQADMFEAYVGGLISSDPKCGVQTVCQWLKRVWGQTIKADVVSYEKKSARSLRDRAALITQEPASQASKQTEGQRPNPMLAGKSKEKLAYAIQVPGVRLKYEDVPSKKLQHGTNHQLFTVKVSLYGYGEAGLFLGAGTALGKKEAGSNAAEQALSNWKLVSKFRDSKLAYLEGAGQKDDAELLKSRTRHLDERGK